MRASDASEALLFEPPGPGTWTQDSVHFPRPMTRYFQQTHVPSYLRGTRDFAQYYGLMIDGLKMAYVNGFGYSQVLPAPDAEIPERYLRAEQVLQHKLWREQLREWDANSKPAAVARHRALQAIDPDALSDAELVAYLTQCRDHHASMMAQHMRFTAGALLPTGDFLAHVGDWTGLPPAELLGLLRGAADVSSGGSEEMQALKKAFAPGSAAREVLAAQGDPLDLLASGGDPAQVLAQLRALPGLAGSAVDGYLALVGNRLIDGFDITEPTALEVPDALLRAINIAVAPPTPQSSGIQAATAAVRTKVPKAQQSAFDELLAEARLTYRLRDERGIYSDIWAAGIMRRAALAAGRKAEQQGRLASAAHVLEADLDEMCALVSGNGQLPAAEELASRAAYRTRYSAKDVPAVLGPTAAPPTDLAKLPPAESRLMRALFSALDHLFASSRTPHEQAVLHGLGASKGMYQGPARRVHGPADFNRITQGDVLVTESTSEAFNILLPLLGAIVTDNGGLLSHAAIVAREYGIPGVVGTREATKRIADGVLLRVDGDNGEVTVLG
ncbi:MAG: PEP-utilizing enzyme [Burkholderiaceae bacterium]